MTQPIHPPELSLYKKIESFTLENLSEETKSALIQRFAMHEPPPRRGELAKITFTDRLKWSGRADNGDHLYVSSLSYFVKEVPEKLLNIELDYFCRVQYGTPIWATDASAYESHKSNFESQFRKKLNHQVNDFIAVFNANLNELYLLIYECDKQTTLHVVVNLAPKTQVTESNTHLDLKLFALSNQNDDRFILEEVTVTPNEHSGFQSKVSREDFNDDLFIEIAEANFKQHVIVDSTTGLTYKLKKSKVASFGISSQFKSLWFNDGTYGSPSFMATGVIQIVKSYKELMEKLLDSSKTQA